jgi:hypothetical protein
MKYVVMRIVKKFEDIQGFRPGGPGIIESVAYSLP